VEWRLPVIDMVLRGLSECKRLHREGVSGPGIALIRGQVSYFSCDSADHADSFLSGLGRGAGLRWGWRTLMTWLWRAEPPPPPRPTVRMHTPAPGACGMSRHRQGDRLQFLTGLQVACTDGFSSRPSSSASGASRVMVGEPVSVQPAGTHGAPVL
jgi:hypothetical protein